MTASNFLPCFLETESFEGGYVNNPHDPGGALLVSGGAFGMIDAFEDHRDVHKGT
jgi:lysozyme family protein